MGFLNHDQARTQEQKELMKKIEQDGVCPFCAEHFKTYHPKPVLKETDYWFVSTNMSPYEGTKHHFLFVYKPSHARSLIDLTSEAYADLLTLMQTIEKEYALEGGSFFMRFGDGKRTGSSVEHLHAHLIVRDGEQFVRVKLG